MDEKIVNTTVEGEEIAAIAECQEITNSDNLPTRKKRIPLKVISTVFYSLVTIAAFAINTWLLIEAITTTNTVTEGWDGLGKAIGLAVVIYLTIIVGAAGIILYQLPACLSLVGLCTSRKAKNGVIREGKIYFAVLFALTVVSEILLALMSAGTILYISISNG